MRDVFRKGLAAAILSLASLLPASAQQEAPTAARRPNIIVIMVDDAAFMDFGVYGGEARTPNIDRLAASGAMMTNYHTSPLCSPSRAMLLTGMDSHRTGLSTIEEVLPPELTQAGGLSHLDVRQVASRPWRWRLAEPSWLRQIPRARCLRGRQLGGQGLHAVLQGRALVRGWRACETAR